MDLTTEQLYANIRAEAQKFGESEPVQAYAKVNPYGELILSVKVHQGKPEVDVELLSEKIKHRFS